MKRLLSSSLIVSLSIAVFAQRNFDEVKISTYPVKDNIYLLQGAGGNIGIVAGDDGIVMIDDQFLPLGPKIKDAIAALDSGPVRFTINTHIHGDHSGGNEFFKQQGSTIVAHEVVRKRMMVEKVNEQNGETIPPRHKDAWPLITFPKQVTFHLNGQDIHLLHFDPGHTDGDVIVWFKTSNVFHMGDLFVTYGYPYIDMSNGGNISGMISSLDEALLLMNDESIIIPGHGNLCKKSDVKQFRDRLADIRDKVANALKNGTKPEDLPSLGITDPYEAEWGKGFIKGKDFVMIVAQALTSK